MQTDLSFTCRHGVLEPVSPMIRRIVAPNGGPFTFRGTGTYVVGHGTVAVIDPGPDLASHVDGLMRGLDGESVSHILVTHTHRDHSPAAAALKRLTGAPTLGFGPHGRVGETGEAGADLDFTPDHALRMGDVVEGRGWRLEAVHTPGHASNHLCFAFPQEAALFSGDHVMGWSTTVVAPPDGDMTQYMRSLELLLDREESVFWPTHGGSIPDPKRHVLDLIQHRRARRTAVLKALGPRPASAAELVPGVYPGLDPALRAAAARSLTAHLIELEQEGLARREGDGWRRA